MSSSKQPARGSQDMSYEGIETGRRDLSLQLFLNT